MSYPVFTQGFTQQDQAPPFGRLYGEVTGWTSDVYFQIVSEGVNASITSADGVTLIGYSPVSNPFINAQRTSSLLFTVKSSVDAYLYRRAKNSNDAWVLETTDINYTSGNFLVNFSLYDYKILIDQ